MIYKRLSLNDIDEFKKAGVPREECKAELICLAAEYSEEIGLHKRPAVLICPGGGYDYVSDREGEPIAFALLASGIQCFVLKYTVQKAFPANLLEAAASMAYIKNHAEEYDVDLNHIFCMGFSAGGHLAATLSVHWNKSFVKDVLGLSDEHRPFGTLLAYPVIAADDTHQGSIDNLCRNGVSEELLKLISLDRQVDSDTPPAFIWHCADDGCVPVSNSLRYAEALNRNKISYSLHIYPEGGHGLALANHVTAKTKEQINKDCEDWVRLAVEWIYGRCGLPM